MVCSGWLKNDSVCACSTHQNVVLLVDAMNWDLTYKDLTKKIVYNPKRNKCIMHWCESCPGTGTVIEFLIRNSTNMKMMRNLITVSGILRIEQYWQPLQPLTKNKKRLWCYWWFKETFLYLKRSLNNQILHYKIILNLCENEMISIRFFGICEGSMISSENLEIEKWCEGGDTVPVTQSSLHLVPLSSPSIGNPLTSKDESYVNIQSISLVSLI